MTIHVNVVTVLVWRIVRIGRRISVVQETEFWYRSFLDDVYNYLDIKLTCNTHLQVNAILNIYIYIAQWSFASITTFRTHSVSLHLSTCCVTGFDVVVQARVWNWGPLFEIWVYMAHVRIWRVDTYLCTCIIDNNSVWNMIFLYETDFTFRSWENVISYGNDLGINPENRLLDSLVV